MEDYLVSREIAEELKLLDFGYPCIRGLNPDKVIISSLWGLNFNGVGDCVSLPFSIQVLDWAVENYNIFSYIVPSYMDEKKRYTFIIGRVSYSEISFETPQAAYIACVAEVIEFVKGIRNERKSISDLRLRKQEDNQPEV